MNLLEKKYKDHQRNILMIGIIKCLLLYHGDESTYAWVIINAYKNNQNIAFGRQQDKSKGECVATFKFLAPDSLMDAISHKWDQMTNPVAESVQKAVNFAESKNMALQVLSGVSDGSLQAIKDAQAGKDLMSTLKSAIGTSMSGNITPLAFKVDSAMIFTDSEHRSITLSLDLFDSPLDGTGRTDTNKD